MLQSAADAIWFYLPVLAANAAVFAVWWRLGLGVPADLGAAAGGRRLMGDSRGLGGIILWLTLAAVAAKLQGRGIEGLYLGAGGVTGTMAASFIKRRMGLEGGKSFFPLDQTDFILGASLFYASAYVLELRVFLIGLAVAAAIHILTNLFVRARWQKTFKRKLTL